MLKYFSPLWTFISGMVITLLMTIFFPAIFTAQQTLEADPIVASGNWWILTNVISSTRLIVFLIFFGFTLFATAKVWLARRN